MEKESRTCRECYFRYETTKYLWDGSSSQVVLCLQSSLELSVEREQWGCSRFAYKDPQKRKNDSKWN